MWDNHILKFTYPQKRPSKTDDDRLRPMTITKKKMRAIKKNLPQVKEVCKIEHTNLLWMHSVTRYIVTSQL